MRRYESWGRYPKASAAQVLPLYWRSDPPALENLPCSVLPFGMGRSYGDTCLNGGGALIDTTAMSRFMSFDPELGILRCEGGVTLDQILSLIVPRGWFLPVTPGTRFITVGGAIANDVHGKNHHVAGTFGRHVTRFELWRSSGEQFICSASENTRFYEATIGGLGLTGLILWAEIQLKRITGPLIEFEQVRFAGLDEFFAVAADSDATHEYTVAWVDCLSVGRKTGRGVFLRGNHVATEKGISRGGGRSREANMPMELPGALMNPLVMKAFNSLYYHAHATTRVSRCGHYEPFFYPLDAIRNWNRIYGPDGFLQYQCVVPSEARAALQELMLRISRSGGGSFLAVLKKFGIARSGGLLSFPRPGITLALDFPFKGRQTLELLEQLDEIVRDSGGAVYPAKDARMSAASFRAYYPRCDEFAKFVDPKFSSNFWRRVGAQA